MIPGFETIVEERIKKAQQEGAFDNLKGEGKPLVFDDLHVPEEFRLAHKILKNAGFLPPEVELRKKITQTEQLLEDAGVESPEKIKLQKKLNFLWAKLGSFRKGIMPSLGTDPYREHILKKLS